MQDVRDAVAQLMDLQNQKAEAENLLSEVNARIDHISRTHLPDVMNAAGLDSVTLADGTVLRLVNIYNGSIKDEEAVMEWLRENNAAAIAQQNFQIKFAKTEEGDELATALQILLEEAGFPYDKKVAIHPQTFKSFLREQCETNPDFPKKLFNVFEGQLVKITKK